MGIAASRERYSNRLTRCPQRKIKQYEYSPLNRDRHEIRLLRIEEWVAEPHDVVQISIKHVSLDDRPNFIALSYTWGPVTPIYEIGVRDKGWVTSVLTVRENLHDFLKVVAREERSPGMHDTWYWIDQLCIDQDNIMERNHSVQQMAKIYREASEVHLWLGEPARDGEKPFAERALSLLAEERLEKEGLWYIIDPEQSTLERFFRLPYWWRLWICQEIAMARTIYIRLGARMHGWDLFFDNCRLVQDAGRQRDAYWIHKEGSGTHKRQQGDIIQRAPLFDSSPLGIGLDRVSKLHRLRSPRETWKLGNIWYNLREIAQTSQCQDVKDKVYGLLGLVGPAEEIEPDYGLSVEAVFHRLALKIWEQPRAELEACFSDRAIRDSVDEICAWRDVLGLAHVVSRVEVEALMESHLSQA